MHLLTITLLLYNLCKWMEPQGQPRAASKTWQVSPFPSRGPACPTGSLPRRPRCPSARWCGLPGLLVSHISSQLETHEVMGTLPQKTYQSCIQFCVLYCFWVSCVQRSNCLSLGSLKLRSAQLHCWLEASTAKHETQHTSNGHCQNGPKLSQI